MYSAVKINNLRTFSSLFKAFAEGTFMFCFVCVAKKVQGNIYFEIKQKRLQENEIENVMCVL
jgi:hypothetical protein